MSRTQASSRLSDRVSSPILGGTSGKEDRGQGFDGDETNHPAAESALSWDLDTDDIRSISSSELYQARPNRWRGPRSTWRTLTERDRLDYEALVALRNQDLAVHLYIAHILKQRRRPGSGPLLGSRAVAETKEHLEEDDADIDAVTGELVRDTAWVPPRAWTAWPMRANVVPQEGLVASSQIPAKDPLEAYTVKSVSSLNGGAATGPSAVLEELLCATILRTAKNRFRRRQMRGQLARGDTVLESRERDEDVEIHIGSRGEPPTQNPLDDNDNDNSAANYEPTSAQPASSPPWPPPLSDPEKPVGPPQTSSQRAEARRTYRPDLAADDDISYGLLRPAAQRIVEMLDRTLLRLHDARLCMTDRISSDESSSASSGDERTDRYSRRGAGSISDGTASGGSSVAGGKKKKRRRGRPRSGLPVPEPKPDIGPDGRRRRGRPRKLPMPFPGESEREMMVRVAQERHQRVPVFTSDDDDGKDEDGSATECRLATMRELKVATGSKTKVIPKQEGESSLDYATRAARERHHKKPNLETNDPKQQHGTASHPIPLRDAMEVDSGRENHSTKSARDVSGRRHGESPVETEPQNLADEDVESTAEASRRKIRARQHIMGRWPLRNWSDVVGAAALTGFSQSVVSRTTQRCANLFGQSMEMHTISEVPAGGRTAAGRRASRRARGGGGDGHDDGMRTTVYGPGGVVSETSLSSASEGEEADGRAHMLRLRSLSRASSVAPASPADDDDDEDTRRRHRSASRATTPHRGRHASGGVSVSSTPTVLRIAARNACPHPSCPRAVKGFERGWRLERHLALVHGEQLKRASRGRNSSRGGSVGADRRRGREKEGDADLDEKGRIEDDGDDDDDDGEEGFSVNSADDMDGAVHVDGFLQPIKIRKGWRTPTLQQTHTPRARAFTRSMSRSRGREHRGGHSRDDDREFYEDRALADDD